MGRTLALALVLLLVAAASAAARTGARNRGFEGPPPLFLVELVDGSQLTGRILAESEDMVVLDIPAHGRVHLLREQIASIQAVPGPRTGDPDFNSVLLTPSPCTVGRGRGYFRAYDVVVFNAGYGLTDRLDVSALGIWPFLSDFVAIGLKYQVVDRQLRGLGFALTGLHVIAEDDQRYTGLGAVLGLGNDRRSINLAVERGVDESGTRGGSVMLGGDLQLLPRAKLLAEWRDSQLDVASDDDVVSGYVTFALRLFGDSTSFTIGAVNPIGPGTDDSSFIPLFLLSAHW